MKLLEEIGDTVNAEDVMKDDDALLEEKEAE